MKNIFLILALCLVPLFAPLSAHATDLAQPALSIKDQQDLQRIEDYLNNLKNISAGFLQIDGAGGMMHGELAIARPGKMRVDYDSPSKNFMIADGDFVHIWNDDLQSQTNVEQGTSLAEFILRDPVRMSGDVTVTKIKRFPAKIEVTLVQTNDPGAGSLTLVFEDRPLKLRQWKVVDPQGRTTGVNLENMSDDAKFPAGYFVFSPPNFNKKS